MPPVTIREAYLTIRNSKLPQVIYASRGLLNTSSFTSKHGKNIMDKNLHKVIGVYDRRIQDGYIEEDFRAWVKKFEAVRAEITEELSV